MLRLKSPQSEKDYPLDKISFNKEENNSHFILQSSQDSNIIISVPYLIELHDSYNHGDFVCCPMVSPFYSKEDNIYEAHANKTPVGRIGWIFPIQALISNDHSKSANQHFLKYAYVAFYNLLQGKYFAEDVIIERNDVDITLELTEIYNSELIILCLSKTKILMIDGFDIYDYLPSLFAQNYFYCNSQFEIKNIISQNENFDDALSKIKITPNAPALKGEIFIKSLFKDLLKVNSHPLVRFHLLYQVVELLINRVYDCEIQVILNKAKYKEKSPHELLMESNKLQTEEFRVKKLVDNYLLKKPKSTKELLRSSNVILIQFGKEKEHVAEAIYSIRNMVVHDFRILNEKDATLKSFIELTNEFQEFLIEVLTDYDETAHMLLGENLPIAWLDYKLKSE